MITSLTQRTARKVALLIAICLGALVQSMARAGTPCPSAEFGNLDYPGFSPIKFEVMPPCAPANGKLAVFVFYFALSDMDYYFGRNISNGPTTSPNSKLFLYRSIASSLVRDGYTVLRYNALGVGCKSDEVAANDNPYCVRSEETLKIRNRDFTGVLAGIINAATSNVPESNRRHIILIGHSAASMVVSDYISDRISAGSDLKNFGFVGIAPVLSAGREAIKHQRVEYWIRKLAACPKKEFSMCSKSVISSDWASSIIDKDDKAYILRAVLAGKDKALPRIERKLSESAKSRMHSDLHPNPNTKVISIEYKNPLHVNLDTVHSIIYGEVEHGKNIAKLPAVSLIFGEVDIAVSAELEMATWKRLGGSEADGRTLPGLGHTLGQDVFWGPPERRGFDAIVEGVDRVARKLDAASVRRP